MKIPAQFIKSTRTLLNKLRREFGKTAVDELTDPVDQLILSILATNANSRRAKSALKHLAGEMTDFNELRVTTIPELKELLHPYTKQADEKAKAIVAALGWVFSKFDTLDLTELRTRPYMEIRSMFEQITACPDHARCAMLLLGFGIPVFPIDDQMLEYLVTSGAMPEKVSLSEVRRFVERHFRSAEVREFYVNVKKASEKASRGSKTKT